MKWPNPGLDLANCKTRKYKGRPPFGVGVVLRIYLLQLWFRLSDVATKEVLLDVPLYRQFAELGNMSWLPDRVSILQFRRLLEQFALAPKMLQTVNATLTAQGLLLKEGTQAIEAQWHVVLRPGKRRALDKSSPSAVLGEQIERAVAHIRAKAEHQFRVIKIQFGYMKVCYRGLAKHISQLYTLFALSNLWTARNRMLAAIG